MAAGSVSDRTEDSSSDRFDECLALLPHIVSSIRQRHRLSASEAEEFEAQARLRLLEDDRAIVRAFRGSSSLRTYLTTVVTRLFLDGRTREWGKWRPSAEARRLGPVAVELERLVARERLSLRDATERLRIRHPEVPEERVRELFERVRTASGRRFEPIEALEGVAAPAPDPEAVALESERQAAAERATRLLEGALSALTPPERLLIRMRFLDGLQIVDIARSLALEPRLLYRRVEDLLNRLRETLLRSGLASSEAEDLLHAATPLPSMTFPTPEVPERVRPQTMTTPGTQEESGS